MTDIDPQLRAEFNADVEKIISDEKALKWYSARFIAMVRRTDGLETTYDLLRNRKREEPLGMFGQLRQAKLQYMTVESLVVQPKYANLFKPSDIEIAQWRLDKAE